MNALAPQLLLAAAAGAVFGLPVFAAAVVLARPFSSAAARYRILAAGFVGAAALSPLAFGAALLRPAGAGGFSTLERALAQHVAVAAVAVVALVAVALLADLCVDLIRLLRIKARSCVDPAVPRQRRRAPVAASARVRTPTAIGYLHPRIVVPADLRARVSAQEWRAIVAHENAHLERYDDWSKALQAAVVRLCWFAPALWALGARLDLERELASDERAVDGFESRAYAACLVRLAADVRRPPPAPAAWLGRSQVALRVERLLKPTPRASGPFAAGARVAALAAVIGVSAVGAAAVVVPAGHSAGSGAVHVIARVAPPGARRAVARRPVPRVRPIRPRAPAPHTDVVASPVARLPVPQRGARAAHKLLALSPGAPCRTCVMLRRPVSDGPARPAAPRAAMSAPTPQVTEAPVETGAEEAGGGVHGYPWNAELLRAVFIVPLGR
ncbi:MAG: M56 family metallopeptidase [Candidatus Velthaea sp.]